MGPTVAAVVSGLLLQMAGPPVEVWWLAPLALVPVLRQLRGQGPRVWAVAGLVIGCIAAAGLVDAGARWSVAVSLGLALVPILQIGVPFAITGVLVGRLAPRDHPIAFAAVWVVYGWVMDEWIYPPVLIGAHMAVHSPVALMVVSTIGATGLEAAVVGTAVVFASPSLSRAFGLVGGCVVVAAVYLRSAEPAAAAGEARLVGVQPQVHWSEWEEAGWSLTRRRQLIRRVDRLTEEAAVWGETVVWPESGDGVSTAQLPGRVRALTGYLSGSGADLLAPAIERDGSRSYLSVFHFQPGGIANRTQKVHLLPGAEAGLQPGSARVLRTGAGPIGVLVCFDALFSPLVRRLVASGAETLVVTTDDGAFGPSIVPRLHLSYAVLHAAEAGRSMLFAANEGPSWSYSAAEYRVVREQPRGKRGTYRVRLPRYQTTTPASLGGRHMAPMIGLGYLLIGWLRRRVGIELPRCFKDRWRLPTGEMVVPAAALIVGMGSDILLRAVVGPNELHELIGSLRKRIHSPIGMDGIGPLFRQSRWDSCGEASLAFLLTYLGDSVFEGEVADNVEAQFPTRHAETGTTFFQLKQVAEQRGFRARAKYVKRLEDLRFALGRGHILHLSHPSGDTHFVVALERRENRIVLFDPAEGAVLEVAPSAIAIRWTGNVLTVDHRPIVPEASALGRLARG